MSGATALLCFLHPTSSDTQDKILSNLTKAIPYYRSPGSLCTAWSYSLPATRKGAFPYKPLSSSFPKSLSERPVIAGLEVYTDKSALSKQMKEDWFQQYHQQSQRESWYHHPEELTVWYPCGGFLSHYPRASGGNKRMVLIVLFTAKPNCKDQLITALSNLATHVYATEPSTSSYALFQRPASKQSNEILLLERYETIDAFKYHCSTEEFKAAGPKIAKLMDLSKTRACEWEEIDGSFVGKEAGQSEAKL